MSESNRQLAYATVHAHAALLALAALILHGFMASYHIDRMKGAKR